MTPPVINTSGAQTAAMQSNLNTQAMQSNASSANLTAGKHIDTSGDTMSASLSNKLSSTGTSQGAPVTHVLSDTRVFGPSDTDSLASLRNTVQSNNDSIANAKQGNEQVQAGSGPDEVKNFSASHTNEIVNTFTNANKEATDYTVNRLQAGGFTKDEATGIADKITNAKSDDEAKQIANDAVKTSQQRAAAQAKSSSAATAGATTATAGATTETAGATTNPSTPPPTGTGSQGGPLLGLLKA